MVDLLKAGDIFSGCKILYQCGKGAYGVVYLAQDAIEHKIAIKVVTTDGNFARELQGVRNYMPVSGTNPNLLKIMHVGEMDSGFFYTMEAADNLCEDDTEYVPATLGNMLRQGKRFTPEEAIRIIRELLQGLTALQNAKLVHRDIKPDNIIFVNGIAKLSDPGLVAEADSRVSLAGTPGFIPPEIIERVQPVDIKSDFYAIGKVFYCMVTGYPPEEYPHLPADMEIEIRRQLFPVLSRMCNNNPSKRFSTAEEILKNLPEELQSPTWLEKKYKIFLNWKTLNREKFRTMLYLLAASLLLLIIGSGTMLFLKKQEKVKLASLQMKVINFRNINQHRKELIPFQFRIMMPNQLSSFLKNDQALQSAVRTKNWQKAVEICNALQEQLQSSAKKLLPVIPEKYNNDFQQGFATVGKARGFLSTPLYSYLPEADKKEYEKQLARFENKVFAGWSGPRCSGTWENFQNYDYHMVFVPPGAVELDHNKKTVHIPYHFWMAKNEVPHAHFTRMSGVAPQRSPYPGTPVERVLWNDVLYYCYSMTTVLKTQNTLPPGYIVRPPTEAEWEYAAKNAWLGKDTIPFANRANIKSNSQNRTQPSGIKSPNKLGINDIFGNVHEIVKPLEPTKMKHCIVIRGGSFLSTEKKCYGRTECLKYQNIPYDIGFRFVVAPGDMSYFEQNFFMGGSNQLRSHGRVFELIGENYGCFDKEKSEQLCLLLGGRLAEPDSPDLLQKIFTEMPLSAAGWPCFIGGKKSNNKWIWSRTGKTINCGKRSKSQAKDTDFPGIHGKRLTMLNSNAKSGIFLCEWDEKTYPLRNKQLQESKKLPLEALRFTIGNRRFMLIKSNMAWYTAKRVCELLGGQLACLETPEIREKVIKKLSDYNSYHILLGGYAKWDDWFWLTGEKISLNLQVNKDIPIPTKNRNFITLKNGAFYNSQYSNLFLCEWRDNISSSN